MAISIDYANARTQAQKLMNISGECGQIRKTVLREKDLLPEYWYGESGATTMELLQAWSNGMESMEKDFQELSSLITRTANEMEEEERQRAERIRARQFVEAYAAQLSANSIGGGAQSTVSTQSFGSGWTDSVKTNTVSSVRSVVKEVNKTTNTITDKLSSFGRSVFSKLTRG